MRRKGVQDWPADSAPRALPAEARWHNRSLVMESLLHDSPLSRADLARETGLTRPATSTIVGELLAVGLVEEVGRRTGGVGKPSTLLSVAANGGCSVCLDLGAEAEVRGALVNLVGQVVEEQVLSRRRFRGAAARRMTCSLVVKLIEMSTSPVLGIGIGTPGVVDTSGRVIDSPNLDWVDVDLRDEIASLVQLPVYVANDANAAAIGEQAFVGTMKPNLLAVKFGFGLGAGLLLHGGVFSGDHHSAGEIGHVVIDPEGPDCSCGRRGCLEAFLAPLLRERDSGAGPIDPDEVRMGGHRLGLVLAPVVAAFDVGTIVVSAPSGLLGDAFLRGASDTIKDRVIAEIGHDLTVRYTARGDSGVLLGAAALVMSGELGVR